MTEEEYSAKSVEAHKNIIDRMMSADDKDIKEFETQQRKEQAAPYVKELEDIIARKHQNGFYSQSDIKRAGELLPLLDKIEKGEYNDTPEDMQTMMADSVKRILEEKRERREAMRQEREDAGLC